MKTSDLIGPALDWAVAKAEGAYAPTIDTDLDGTKRVNYGGMLPEWSTDWSQGGPIIEREKIEFELGAGTMPERAWWASTVEHETFGPTPLIAAMRCYVASKLGDEIDIPKELL